MPLVTVPAAIRAYEEEVMEKPIKEASPSRSLDGLAAAVRANGGLAMEQDQLHVAAISGAWDSLRAIRRF
jgi:hypothetical protein